MNQKLKKQTFFFVMESFLDVESCVVPLQEALTKGFISFCAPMSFKQYMRYINVYPTMCSALFSVDPDYHSGCRGVISSHRIKFNHSLGV